jgi:hypothetical protein
VYTSVKDGQRTQVSVSPDGTKTTAKEYAASVDASGVPQAAGAFELVEKPDGTKIERESRADGYEFTQTTLANGTIKVSSRLPNGTEENFTATLNGEYRGTVKYPDGTIVETIEGDEERDVVVLYADGLKEHINIKLKDEFRETTTITEYPDLTIVRRQEDKKKSTTIHGEFCSIFMWIGQMVRCSRQLD